MSEWSYDGSIGGKDEENGPVVRLFYEILLHGYDMGASDIHLEPTEEDMQIRMRVDGILRVERRLEKTGYLPLITCAKIRSGMDIAEKRLPQDGHCRVNVMEMALDLRVSTMPTVYGEKMVLRYLNREMVLDRADRFGMDTAHYQKMTEMMRRPSGIIYFTGPTGSGKTTTLYMILEQMAKDKINIMTMEDPVERTIRGVCQSQVNRHAGFTFETGLRAILRQDPDVIMVGETRDEQTAKICVRAAAAGNLVFSTLHTKDAVGAVSRLENLGVEPYMAAETLNGVVSQRPVRKVCDGCAQNVRISKEEAKILGTDIKVTRRGTGCPLCGGTGYLGRIAVHEILIIDKTIRTMIREQIPAEKIDMYARETQKMVSLRESVTSLVEQGITTLEEWFRLIDFE